MKATPAKCLLVIKESCKREIMIAGNVIESSKCKKLLAIKINSKLSSKTHVEDLCKKASHKFHVLPTITPYMDLPKKRNLFTAFFKFQFSYCPLAWMCHTRNKPQINAFHERYLQIIYNSKQFTFKKLLDKGKSVTIHNRNMQTQATEMFKSNQGFGTRNFFKCF